MKNENASNKKLCTYDDYRCEIKMIISRNKRRIKITEVLNECGISRGNYYTFLSGGKEYKGKMNSTLSYEKLDKLLEALRAADYYADNKANTNRNKMESMTNKKMAQYLKENLLSDPKAEKIDVLKWLESTDPNPIYEEETNK